MALFVIRDLSAILVAPGATADIDPHQRLIALYRMTHFGSRRWGTRNPLRLEYDAQRSLSPRT